MNYNRPITTPGYIPSKKFLVAPHHPPARPVGLKQDENGVYLDGRLTDGSYVRIAIDAGDRI